MRQVISVFGTAAALAIALLCMVMAFGWGSNISAIAHHSEDGESIAILILRIVGVPFFPLGALLGFY